MNERPFSLCHCGRMSSIRERLHLGPVATADLQISGEKASSLPIQVLSDSDFRAPTACASIGPSEDTLAALGANGILGVGTLAQDSGGGCALPGRPILASIMSVRRRAVW